MAGQNDYRERCLAVNPNHCSICGDTGRLEVHHIDGERDNNLLTNLKPLCGSCHSKVHHCSPGYEDWFKKIKNPCDYDSPIEAEYAKGNASKWKAKTKEEPDSGSNEPDNDTDNSDTGMVDNWMDAVKDDDNKDDDVVVH